jgi:hypothetical protein
VTRGRQARSTALVEQIPDTVAGCYFLADGSLAVGVALLAELCHDLEARAGEANMGFDAATIALTLSEREVDLTTFGRKTGTPSRRTLWIWGDDQHVYIRPGQGIGRDWPRNLLANGRGIRHTAGRDIAVRARHVDDPAEARAGAAMVNRKYAAGSQPSEPGGALTLGEQATFELTPAPA